MTDEDRLAAEQRARVLIDRPLTEGGWVVQDRRDLNLFAGQGVAVRSLFAGQGVAVREVIMTKGHGLADYLLYVDLMAVGVVEAKPQGTPLSGVEWQSAMYAEGLVGKSVQTETNSVGNSPPSGVLMEDRTSSPVT